MSYSICRGSPSMATAGFHTLSPFEGAQQSHHASDFKWDLLKLQKGFGSRGTKECRKGQHWLCLQELVTCCIEPINGLCLALGQ